MSYSGDKILIRLSSVFQILVEVDLTQPQPHAAVKHNNQPKFDKNIAFKIIPIIFKISTLHPIFFVILWFFLFQ